jgi:hypothetical protein
MKIAIIGAGWVGCHLSKKLIDQGLDVTLFEQKEIFSSTSLYNQNRLHLGFHYPRNYRTRVLCKTTFDRFQNDYSLFVDDVDKNIYSIPKKSVIDLETFKVIMESAEIDYSNIVIDELLNIEGSINTDEKYINFKSVKTYFKTILKNYIVYERVEDIKFLSTKFDWVINCTNNFIKTDKIPAYYEIALSLVYEKIKDTEFNSLTLMDGNFFSIYPYIPKENKFTLTDVEFTPLYIDESIDKINDFKSSISYKYVDKIKEDIENKVRFYFPEFNNHFIFCDYFTSIKVKTYNHSADRYPIIEIEDNIINCFTGKIQGIYIIEDKIKEILKNDN